ncbi:hypothetical protein COCMIDRAFT_53981, partial [Bipolaris oryzae ATCC 44560]
MKYHTAQILALTSIVSALPHPQRYGGGSGVQPSAPLTTAPASSGPTYDDLPASGSTPPAGGRPGGSGGGAKGGLGGLVGGGANGGAGIGGLV